MRPKQNDNPNHPVFFTHLWEKRASGRIGNLWNLFGLLADKVDPGAQEALDETANDAAKLVLPDAVADLLVAPPVAAADDVPAVPVVPNN